MCHKIKFIPSLDLSAISIEWCWLGQGEGGAQHDDPADQPHDDHCHYLGRESGGGEDCALAGGLNTTTTHHGEVIKLSSSELPDS